MNHLRRRPGRGVRSATMPRCGGDEARHAALDEGGRRGLGARLDAGHDSCRERESEPSRAGKTTPHPFPSSAMSSPMAGSKRRSVAGADMDADPSAYTGRARACRAASRRVPKATSPHCPPALTRFPLLLLLQAGSSSPTPSRPTSSSTTARSSRASPSAPTRASPARSSSTPAWSATPVSGADKQKMAVARGPVTSRAPWARATRRGRRRPHAQCGGHTGPCIGGAGPAAGAGVRTERSHSLGRFQCPRDSTPVAAVAAARASPFPSPTPIPRPLQRR
jgi:hypothetical protein